MKTEKAFHDRIMKVLIPFGVTSRAMFGGYGLYIDKIIFGAIIEDKLYFRCDDTTKKDFENYGSHPFIFEGSGKPVRMPYMTLPDEIFKNSEKLKEWIQKARESSLSYKLKSKKKAKSKRVH